MDEINKTATVEGYKLFDGFSSIKKIGSKWLSANSSYCKSANVTSNTLIRRRSYNLIIGPEIYKIIKNIHKRIEEKINTCTKIYFE